MRTLIVRLATWLMLSWSVTVLAGGVSIDGDLFLGVWSPMQNRWESRVPVCVSSEVGQSPYRVLATGDQASAFAMTNDIDDQVRYKVFWHTGKNFKKRAELQAAVPSRKVFSDSGNCQVKPTAYIRVKLDKQDINNAIPAIYQDTLLVLVSPL